MASQVANDARIVEYATGEQAQQAVNTLSNQSLMGRLVYVREVSCNRDDLIRSYSSAFANEAMARIERPSLALPDRQQEVEVAMKAPVVAVVMKALVAAVAMEVVTVATAALPRVVAGDKSSSTTCVLRQLLIVEAVC